MHFEGAQREAVVGGGEDVVRLAACQLHHLEAVQLRHLDVEEDQLGVELADRLDRLEAVGAFADDLDVGVVSQVFAQQRARQVFVVHDQHSHAASPMFYSFSVSAGSTRSTRNVSSSRAQCTLPSLP